MAPETRQALQVGAIVGQRVGQDDWQNVCAAVGVATGPQLWQPLVDRGLVLHRSSGWEWAAAEARVAVAGLDASFARSVHDACVEVLTLDHRGRGDHLLEAGREREAVTALLKAANALALYSRFEESLEVLDTLKPLLMGREDTDPDRLSYDLRWLARRNTYRRPDVRARAEELVARALGCGAIDIMVEATLYLSMAARRDHDLDGAIAALTAATTHLPDKPTHWGWALADNLGHAALELPDYERAIAHYRHSLEIGRAMGDDLRTAVAHNNIASTRACQGRYADAVRHGREACELMPVAFPRRVMLVITHALALARLGEHDQALALVAEAQEHAEHALGSVLALMAHLAAIGVATLAADDEVCERGLAMAERWSWRLLNFDHDVADLADDVCCILVEKGEHDRAMRLGALMIRFGILDQTVYTPSATFASYLRRPEAQPDQ